MIHTYNRRRQIQIKSDILCTNLHDYFFAYILEFPSKVPGYSSHKIFFTHTYYISICFVSFPYFFLTLTKTFSYTSEYFTYPNIVSENFTYPQWCCSHIIVRVRKHDEFRTCKSGYGLTSYSTNPIFRKERLCGWATWRYGTCGFRKDCSLSRKNIILAFETKPNFYKRSNVSC